MKSRIVLILGTVLISFLLVGMALAAAEITSASPHSEKNQSVIMDFSPKTGAETLLETDQKTIPDAPQYSRANEGKNGNLSLSDSGYSGDHHLPPPVNFTSKSNDLPIPKSSFQKYEFPKNMRPSGAGPVFMSGHVPEPSGFSIGPQFTPPVPGLADIVVCLTSDRVWGVANPGDSLTVTVDGEQMGASPADGVGFYWTTLYDSEGDRPRLKGEETIDIYQNGVDLAGTIIRSISGSIDLASETVSGEIGGSSFPISVTIYLGAYAEPSMSAYSLTISTDNDGHFEADFSGVWDFVAWDEAVVAYTQDSIEVHRHVYAQRGLMVRTSPFQFVFGRSTPDTSVTITLLLSDNVNTKESDVVQSDPVNGFYFAAIEAEFAETDIVAVELEDETVMSRTIEHLTEFVDAENDRIVGEAPAGEKVRGRIDFSLSPLGATVAQTETTADATGVYTLNFNGIADIMPGDTAAVFMADAEGDDLNPRANAPSVVVNQTWDEVSGYGQAPFNQAEGWPVTLTLYNLAEDTTHYFSKGLEKSGWYSFNPDDGLPDITAGDVITVETENTAWQETVLVMTMTTATDFETDQFTGEVISPSGRVEISAWNGQSQLYPVNGFVEMRTEASSPYTATLNGFDIRNHLGFDVSHRTVKDQVERISGATGGLGAVVNYNAVMGKVVESNIPFTITLSDSGDEIKAQMTGVSSQPAGDIGWNDFWNHSRVEIQTGDKIWLQSETGFSQTLIVPSIEIYPDTLNNAAYGFAPANQLLLASVDNEGQGFIPTKQNGEFSFKIGQLQEFGEGVLNWGENIWLQRFDENWNWVYRGFQWPKVVAHYEMDGRNDVWGEFAIPGNPIYITVTDQTDAVIATGTTIAGDCEWCNSNQYQLFFPDGTIAPDHIVTANFGDGFVISTTAVALTGYADVDTDIVTGTAPTDTYLHLNADCWQGGCWTEMDNVAVDSSGIYTADFGALGYDIQHGDRFNVHYADENRNETQYSFWIPAPDLRIEKWNPGGHARPGGKYVYGVRYNNDGNGEAANTLIVDTLPPSTTWAGDTSGVTPEIGNGVITWNLGTLAPYDQGYFMVTLDVSDTVPSGESNLQQNCVQISTDSPGDLNPGNETSCADEVNVWDDDIGVTVNKSPNPGDPSPSQEFDYEINICSESGAAYGPVWLTDTFPAETTLLDWQTDNPDFAFWEEVSASANQLVLYAPGLPGDFCHSVRTRLLLDFGAVISTSLENTIEVTTPNDINSENNRQVNTDAHVSPPRYDLNVNKWYNNGVLVPGGWVNFGANYWNAGNTAVHAWITDTLPAGTSYRVGSAYDHNGNPFEPVTVTEDIVVWDLGEVAVNRGFGFDLVVDISASAPSGTVLENCAEVGLDGAEETPWDNVACASATINPPGPNLRVRKWSDWNGDGSINYQIQFENIGDEAIEDVWVTDTLPIATTWNGWWDMGFDWGRLEDTDLTDSSLRWKFSELYPGDSGWLYFNADLDDPNTRPGWYTNTVTIDTPPGDVYPADNLDEILDVKGEIERAEMWVGTEHSNLWGEALLGAPVTVTTAYTQVVTTANDPDCEGCWHTDDVGSIYPGDTITVIAEDGELPVIITVPDPFDAYASSITNTVWGQIDGAAGDFLDVNGYWTAGNKRPPIDGSNRFVAPYMDIPRGGRGYIRYPTAIDRAEVMFHRYFRDPQLVLRVNYGHDWVGGDYDPGYTISITVKDSGGDDKATAIISSTEWSGWGQPGFETQEDQWSPSQPDIQDGDWIHATVLDNGYTNTVQVGEISGDVDADADAISGGINANWFSEPLNVRCEVWVENGPEGIDTTADPNGGSYYCNFGALGWDILPGQDIAVRYEEPDNDLVINVFSEPAPHLRVSKSPYSTPAEGGNLSFRVEYWNVGGAEAQDVIITDTMQGLAYISDTSGYLTTTGSTPSGDYVAWQLGTVSASSHGSFDVFLQVNEPASSTITNTVQISTTNPFDQGNPGEKTFEWSGHVEDNDTHLAVNKYAWTGDPVPGHDFVWVANVCNHGGTESSAIVLTDTLPISTTLLYWWGQHTGWTEVVNDSSKLVVSRPSLPNGWCSEVYLKLHLDDSAWTGMQITNTAVITASNDLEDGDNEALQTLSVGEPHTNIRVDKWWNRGSLVPGGELYYGIQYHNNGNLPVGSFRITDTLPANTTFRIATIGGGETPFVPVYTGTSYVVWEVSGLENGYAGDFEVVLDVDSSASPGDVLTNTVEISQLPGEDTYDDNTSVWVEQLFDHGPNLRITKDGQWDNWGENTRRASYSLRVENVGDETIGPVTITDTYDTKVYLDGGVNTNYWMDWSWSDHPASSFFTATFESLRGSESVMVYLATISDTEPLPFGFIFTNTAEVDLPPGDINPLDNISQRILTTGPDLYVRKSLMDGSFAPGDTITFSLQVGNDIPNWQWWWGTNGNVWITDTLPAGLEFITATRQAWGWKPFTPDRVEGNEIAWDLDSFGPAQTDEIYVTVRIIDTASNGEILTNDVEIASSDPADIEPYYPNNSASASVTVSTACTPLTGVDFPYFPISPLVNNPVTFTANITPAEATLPITYTWIISGSAPITQTNPILVHSFTSDGAYDVTLRAFNGCTPTPPEITKPVIINPRRVFLPLVMKR